MWRDWSSDVCSSDLNSFARIKQLRHIRRSGHHADFGTRIFAEDLRHQCPLHIPIRWESPESRTFPLAETRRRRPDLSRIPSFGHSLADCHGFSLLVVHGHRPSKFAFIEFVKRVSGKMARVDRFFQRFRSAFPLFPAERRRDQLDRKSTRLNSSHAT